MDENVLRRRIVFDHHEWKDFFKSTERIHISCNYNPKKDIRNIN
jgi:hypothetical protein